MDIAGIGTTPSATERVESRAAPANARRPRYGSALSTTATVNIFDMHTTNVRFEVRDADGRLLVVADRVRNRSSSETEWRIQPFGNHRFAIEWRRHHGHELIVDGEDEARRQAIALAGVVCGNVPEAV